MAVVPQLEGENSWNEIHVSLSTPGKNLVVYHCSRQGNKTFLAGRGERRTANAREETEQSASAKPMARQAADLRRWGWESQNSRDEKWTSVDGVDLVD
jgi:hypothetical protein